MQELTALVQQQGARQVSQQKEIDQLQRQNIHLKQQLAAGSGKPAGATAKKTPETTATAAAPGGKAASLLKSILEPNAADNDAKSVAVTGTSSISGTTKMAAKDKESDAATETMLKQIGVAFDVPDSLSAAILGVAPQKVTRPSTPAQAVASVLSAVDEHGNFQAGVAVDVSPYAIYMAGQGHTSSADRNDQRVRSDKAGRPNLSSSDLQEHEALESGKYLRRLAERTQLSLATIKGTEDADKSTRLAFGIQTTLMNETDPLYRAAITSADEAAKSLGLSYDQARHANSWHYNSSWNVGAAQVIIDRNDSSGNFRSGATGVFSIYSYGFEGVDHLLTDAMARTVQTHGQLLLDVRYLDHDVIPDPAKTGSFLPENSVRGALRLRMGYPDVNFGIIETVTHEWLSNRENTSHETDAALEVRLPGSGTWVTASIGKEFDRSDGKSPVVVLGGVKIGYSQQP